jgi:hypothetical protein
MDMNIPNHITLEALQHMPVGEIAGLPAAELARLQQETSRALRAAKMACEWLDGALALKYADRADALRRTAQKDTGTVRFADGEITVKADLPKRVAWDQAHLARMVERIRAAGDDPAEIINISYKVAERKFAAWPTSMQAAFRDARAVHPGKLKITLSDEGAAQ